MFLMNFLEMVVAANEDIYKSKNTQNISILWYKWCRVPSFSDKLIIMYTCYYMYLCFNHGIAIGNLIKVPFHAQVADISVYFVKINRESSHHVHSSQLIYYHKFLLLLLPCKLSIISVCHHEVWYRSSCLLLINFSS